jgi:hypothetical protein
VAISKWGVYAFAMPGPCDSLPTLPGSPAHPPTHPPAGPAAARPPKLQGALGSSSGRTWHPP